MTGATSAGKPSELEGLLREMVRLRGSDLHLTAGQPPRVRIDGSLAEMGDRDPLAAEDTLRLARSLLATPLWRRFEEDDELDFAFEVPELARFRGNCFRQRGCVALSVRHIPHEVAPLEELGLPSILNHFAQRPRGLVLVTGPTGSGKSTTLAAMVDSINRRRRGHILTVEDPIEFVHRSRRCIVNQREVGTDTRTFAAALKYALRQDPDVILIGEMRDPETIGSALTIAETGHLVLSTLHTNSAADSVNRIIDAFPSGRQAQVRNQLASVLEGVVTQILVPRALGPGRVAAAEVLVCTAAVRAVIRDEKVHQLGSLMQAGRKHGMQTLNDALARLYLKGDITLEGALKRSSEPRELLRAVGEPAPEGTGGGGEGWG